MVLRHFQSLAAPHSLHSGISPPIEVDLYEKWQTFSPTLPLIKTPHIEVPLYIESF